ncbi:MAG: hypothetical protein ACRDRT_03185 [Pseudonocardiaceae bacterium]
MMALLVILAILAVAFGCWFDDEIHRHTERDGGAYHGLPADADIGHSLGTIVALGHADVTG